MEMLFFGDTTPTTNLHSNSTDVTEQHNKTRDFSSGFELAIQTRVAAPNIELRPRTSKAIMNGIELTGQSDLDFQTPHSNKTPVRANFKVQLERIQGKPLDVAVLQLSNSEMRIMCAKPLDVKELVRVTICDEDDNSIWQSPGEVHWSHHSYQRNEAGIYLSLPIPEALTRWDDWDMRSELRYPVAYSGQLWWHDRDDSVNAKVINYSSTGIGIYCPDPGQIGNGFVFVTSDSGQSMIVVTGTCCWQVNHQHGFIMGCELPGNLGRRFAGVLHR